MATDINSNNLSISSIKALSDNYGNYTVLADSLSSFNFDGSIPKKMTPTPIFEVKAGDVLFNSDPFYSDSGQYIVTKTEEITQDDGSVRNYLYVLTSENIEEPYKSGSTFDDGGFDDAAMVYILTDDVSGIRLGTDGWALTRNGNAILSNVFVRGKVEATSGKFDGFLTAGTDSSGQPLVAIGSNLFGGTTFESRSEEHSGIYIDDYNYLLSFNGISQIPVTRVDVSNTTETGHTNYIELIIGSHSLTAGDAISVEGIDEEFYPLANGPKIITSVTATTISFKLDDDVTGTTNPISSDFIVTSEGIDGIISGSQFNYSQVNDPTTNTSSVKIYTSTEFLTSISQYDFVTFENFTNSNLLDLNGSFQIISINSTYFTVSTPRLTTGTNITTGLGNISKNQFQSKFKIGNDSNNLTFTSETGDLSVTGAITATSGSFSGYMTAGNNFKIGSNVSGTNDGLWINDYNYLYDNGAFSLGSIDNSISLDPTFGVLKQYSTQFSVTTTQYNLTTSYSNISGNIYRFNLATDSYITVTPTHKEIISTTTSRLYMSEIDANKVRIGDSIEVDLSVTDTSFEIAGTSSVQVLNRVLNGSNSYIEYTRPTGTTARSKVVLTGSNYIYVNNSYTDDSITFNNASSVLLASPAVTINDKSFYIYQSFGRGFSVDFGTTISGSLSTSPYIIRRDPSAVFESGADLTLNLRKVQTYTDAGVVQGLRAPSYENSSSSVDGRIIWKDGEDYLSWLKAYYYPRIVAAGASQKKVLEIHVDNGTINIPSSTASISATANSGDFIIGTLGSAQLAIDSNSIQARTIGGSTGTTLQLNPLGGSVVVAGTIFSGGRANPDDLSSDTGIAAGSRLVVTSPSNSSTLTVHRAGTNSGTLVNWAIGGAYKGYITVNSSGTVSYGTFTGSHWSQIQGASSRLDILPGTVLEAVDELCEWIDSSDKALSNNNLPKVKVSDTEESSSVYGVFDMYDNDDEEFTNDIYVVSLGAWLCRIDQNENPVVGDLLVSAGNGCAKVQSDDIIRSKTIGKVTSTQKYCTYDDGSYVIPVVLYCG